MLVIDPVITPVNLIGIIDNKSREVSDYFANGINMVSFSTPDQTQDNYRLGDRVSSELNDRAIEAKKVIQQLALDNPALSSALDKEFKAILSSTREKVARYGNEWFDEMENEANQKIQAIGEFYPESLIAKYANEASYEDESNLRGLTEQENLTIQGDLFEVNEMHTIVNLTRNVVASTLSMLDTLRAD